MTLRWIGVDSFVLSAVDRVVDGDCSVASCFQDVRRNRREARVFERSRCIECAVQTNDPRIVVAREQFNRIVGFDSARILERQPFASTKLARASNERAPRSIRQWILQ